MSTKTILEKLKYRLSEYTETEVYKLNNYPKDVVSAILIAINLVEIASRNNSKIREEDRIWFKGNYQIARNFDDPQWQDIGKLYDELISIVEKNFY